MEQISDFLQWSSLTGTFIIVIGLISALVALTNSFTLRKKTIFAAVVFAIFLIWRYAYQPVAWGTYGDRCNYALNFLDIKNNGLTFDEEIRDPLWTIVMYVISMFGEYELFFIVIAILYVGIYYTVSYKLSGSRVYWMLIVFAVSFGFTSYAVNTMRAGLAAALLCLALCYRRKLTMMLILMTASVFTHLSMLLPAAMLLVCRYFDRTKLYIALWFLAVPISFAAGEFFNDLFAGLITDQRVTYLTTTEDDVYNIGFRFDFIIYSVVPLLLGAYFIYKKNFKDKLYKMLFNGYILANIFGILVIRANFSDRFAYLSWFLIPIILSYPLVQQKKVVRHPGLWLAAIISADTIFMMFI